MKPLFPMLLLLPSLLSAQVNQENQRVPIALTHVAVIDTNRASIQHDMTVVVVGDHIANVSKAAQIKVPNNAQIIDGRGKFLIPGLWDMHTHVLDALGHVGTGEDLSSIEHRKRGFQLLIANGVTGIRDMYTIVPLSALARIKQQVANAEVIGPRIVCDRPSRGWRSARMAGLNCSAECAGRT